MLKFTLVLLIGLTLSFNMVGQKKDKKRSTYKTWVSLLDNKSVVKGYFHELKDSSIVIFNSKNKELIELPVSNIDKIKIRKKNRIGRGAGIGAASGLLFGAILGYSDGDDPPDTILFRYTAEEKAGASAIMFLPIGAGIGAGIGSIKKHFDIGGSIVNYKALKPKLSNTLF